MKLAFIALVFTITLNIGVVLGQNNTHKNIVLKDNYKRYFFFDVAVSVAELKDAVQSEVAIKQHNSIMPEISRWHTGKPSAPMRPKFKADASLLGCS